MRWCHILPPHAASLFAAVLVAIPAFAQPYPPTTGDSLPFRTGQWGAQFTASSEHRNVGLLRFRSPRTAWVFTADVSLNAGDSEGTENNTQETTDESDKSRRGAVSVRTGYRRYKPVAMHAGSFFTVGVLGGAMRAKTNRDLSYGDGTDVGRSASWNLGVFGELGATYLIIPNVSLGVIASVDTRYTRGWSNYERKYFDRTYRGQGTSRGISVDTELLSVVATVYF
jgi:hypothetical protein